MSDHASSTALRSSAAGCRALRSKTAIFRIPSRGRASDLSAVPVPSTRSGPTRHGHGPRGFAFNEMATDADAQRR